MSASGKWRGKRVAVLMGGISPEREISLLTGNAMVAALVHKGYSVRGIDIKNVADYVSLFSDALDVAVLGLHGPYGEDGTIQGLLEMLRIPYTGSGVLASALCMDKVRSKSIFQLHDIATPRFMLYEKGMNLGSVALPAVVKPCRQGSTIGICVVKERQRLQEAIEEAERYDDVVLVEEYIAGKEIAIGIFEGRAFTPVDITPQGELYDLDAKYYSEATEYHVPARIPGQTQERLKEIALSAYSILGCRGAVRADFIVDSSGRPFLLELNTLPGMTSHSLLPKVAAHDGIAFDDLVEQILDAATLDYYTSVTQLTLS